MPRRSTKSGRSFAKSTRSALGSASGEDWNAASFVQSPAPPKGRVLRGIPHSQSGLNMRRGDHRRMGVRPCCNGRVSGDVKLLDGHGRSSYSEAENLPERSVIRYRQELRLWWWCTEVPIRHCEALAATVLTPGSAANPWQGNLPARALLPSRARSGAMARAPDQAPEQTAARGCSPHRSVELRPRFGGSVYFGPMPVPCATLWQLVFKKLGTSRTRKLLRSMEPRCALIEFGG